MATKRRKVWVNEYDADDEGPGGLGDLAWTTKEAALASISSDGKAVPFLERLPGDVVLSREDAESLRFMLEKIGQRTPSNGVSYWLARLALLRGRR